MPTWDWEIFNEEISKGSYQLSSDTTFTTVNELSAERDAGQRITIKATTSNNNFIKHSRTPIGTVERNTNKIILENEFGTKITIYGFGSISQTQSHNGKEEVYQTTLGIQSIEGEYPTKNNPTHTIEWILNWPNEFLMPHTVKTSIQNTVTKFIDTQSINTSLKSIDTTTSLSRSRLSFMIDGQNISICSLDRKDDKNFRRAFILYDGVPTDEFRKKLRECVSFFLGSYLVSLGYSRFDNEWNLTNFKAISAYDYG